MNAEPQYLTPREIAEELRVCEDTARNLFRSLPGVMLIGVGERQRVRVPRAVFEAWKEEHTVRVR